MRKSVITQMSYESESGKADGQYPHDVDIV